MSVRRCCRLGLKVLGVEHDWEDVAHYGAVSDERLQVGELFVWEALDYVDTGDRSCLNEIVRELAGCHIAWHLGGQDEAVCDCLAATNYEDTHRLVSEPLLGFFASPLGHEPSRLDLARFLVAAIDASQL